MITYNQIAKSERKNVFRFFTQIFLLSNKKGLAIPPS